MKSAPPIFPLAQFTGPKTHLYRNKGIIRSVRPAMPQVYWRRGVTKSGGVGQVCWRRGVTKSGGVGHVVGDMVLSRAVRLCSSCYGISALIDAARLNAWWCGGTATPNNAVKLQNCSAQQSAQRAGLASVRCWVRCWVPCWQCCTWCAEVAACLQDPWACTHNHAIMQSIYNGTMRHHTESYQ